MRAAWFGAAAMAAALTLGACSGKKDEPPQTQEGAKPTTPTTGTTAAPAAPAAPATAAPPAAPAPSGAPAAAGDPKAQAEELFQQRCVTCHGATGVGDGPAAANLPVKPRNYQDAEWQAKVTDEALRKAIIEGGPAVGLSPLMPPNPDLKDKTEVVDALVAKIRGFKK